MPIRVGASTSIAIRIPIIFHIAIVIVIAMFVSTLPRAASFHLSVPVRARNIFSKSVHAVMLSSQVSSMNEGAGTGAKVGARAEDGKSGTATVNFETSDGVQVITVQKGEILRTAMLKRGLSPHNGKSRLINCRGLGTCGTCAVEITPTGSASTSIKSTNEENVVLPVDRNTRERLRLNFPPHGSPDQSPHLRLACQVQIQDTDVNVKKRCGFWGQDSSEDDLLVESHDAQLYFGELEFVLDDKSPPT